MYELIQLKKAFGTDNQKEVPAHDKIPEIDAEIVPHNLKLNLSVLYKK